MFNRMKEFIVQSIAVDFTLFVTILCILAWLTHIIHCYMAVDKFVLLFVGGFIFPIGIIHGFGLWAGVF